MTREDAEALATELNDSNAGLATYTVEETDRPSLGVEGFYVCRHRIRARELEGRVGSVDRDI